MKTLLVRCTMYVEDGESGVYQTTKVMEEGSFIVMYRKRRLLTTNGNFKKEEGRFIYAIDEEQTILI